MGDSRDRGSPKGWGKKGKKGMGKGKGKKGMDEDLFKVRVTNIPSSASWQDLKDFLKGQGKRHQPRFTDVRDGEGIGGFGTKAEAEDCIEDCDGREMTARNGDKETVRVEFDGGPGRGSPPRGRSDSRKR